MMILLVEMYVMFWLTRRVIAACELHLMLFPDMTE